eukprot:TRINITY_DN1215_c1_g1_i1.p4 TRINITY_DN1215_c1_g1~~TRINITY_DN1215_c1_g1_i1.p4  ORF type:complete len:106 (-),score=8.60 TRINITY_DN1215_c1_g1_i1:466-783(-)
MFCACTAETSGCPIGACATVPFHNHPSSSSSGPVLPFGARTRLLRPFTAPVLRCSLTRQTPVNGDASELTGWDHRSRGGALLDPPSLDGYASQLVVGCSGRVMRA